MRCNRIERPPPRAPDCCILQSAVALNVAVIRAGSTTAGAITDRLGLPRWTVRRRLATMVERGLIIRTSATRSRQSYRLVDPEEG